MFQIKETQKYKTQSGVSTTRYYVLVSTGSEPEFEVYIDVDRYGRQFDGSYRKDTEIGKKLLECVTNMK